MDNRATILIVDDQEVNRLILEVVLQDQYQIMMAENGRQAYDIVTSQKVDLILLDLVMPVMDGFELLRLLHAKADFEYVPVILITSEATEQNLYKGVDYGITDMIVKPFDPTQVLERVARALSPAGRQGMRFTDSASWEDDLTAGWEEELREMNGLPPQSQAAPAPTIFRPEQDIVLISYGGYSAEIATLCHLFEGEHEVIMASSNEEALTLIEGCYETISLITLEDDPLSPEVEAIVELLQQLSPGHPIPLLFLAGDQTNEQRLKDFHYELYDVMPQPLQEKILQNRANNLIELRWKALAQ